MKIKYVVLSLLLASLSFNSYAHSQEYDKAAQEKAAMDKEEVVKREQAQQQQNKQNNIAPQYYYNKPEANQAPAPLAQNNIRTGQFISCPIQMIEARITTPLSGDWWETPQQGRLQNTEVIQMSGGQTLQCYYQAYGTRIPIMKRSPAGLNCVAQANGFQCN